MTTMKKLATASAATILALSVAASTMAFTTFADNNAEDATKYTISVAEGSSSSYVVYQLLTGDIADDGVTITNAVAGTNLNTSDNSISGKTGNALAKAIAALDADAIAALKTGTGSSLTNDSLSVVEGYYLLVETDASGKTANHLVVVDENTTITTKLGQATFQKKLKDTNDTTNTTTEWQDGADWDVGDSVPFQLKATLPENVTSYEGYYLQFQDELSAAFDVSTVSISKVYIKNGSTETTLASGYTLATDKDKNSFTVTFADVKVLGATNNAEVYVEYTATLGSTTTAGKEGDNVVYGGSGNPNTAKLVYSNNPSFDMYSSIDFSSNTDKTTPDANDTPKDPSTPSEGSTESTDVGTSTEDKVVVFTYITKINKVDEDGNALTGAEFELYKVDSSGNASTTGVTVVAADSKFTFYGLDDGKYVLKEVKTPDGYNGIDDITFTVTGTHTETEGADGVISLTELEATGLTASTTQGVVSTGTISADITNEKGPVLPETGGMGTKLFFIGGGAVVLASGVLLVTKKRMKNHG